MMQKFIVVVVGALLLAFSSVADAQQAGKVPRIGLLSPIALNRSTGSTSRNPRSRAFEEGLRELGWIEGKNVTIERRGTGGKPDGLRESAADLVQLKVDVIVTRSTPPAKAAKAATSTIPIVIIDPGDPVGIGLVDSLARPGGNITGLSSIAPDLAAQRLELLKETFPKASRVAILFNVAIPPAEVGLKEMRLAAPVFGQQLQFVEVQGADGFERAFEAMTTERATALVVFPDPLTFTNQKVIVDFTIRSRIPTIFGESEFVNRGGLMSYGPSYP
ncbi:MAG TPA: ABC transporter substrate-binding protein, partial [Candidatus Binatia bacterium]|nr:ABC transporter substrate-binding protein [Candidatus Binatia bacterium]